MLALKRFQTLNGSDSVTSRLQQNVATALDPVLGTVVLDGNWIRGQVIPASGTLTFGHGLGRAVNGYVVTRASAAFSPPYMVAAEQTTPNNRLTLHFPTGAGATVDMWVF